MGAKQQTPSEIIARRQPRRTIVIAFGVAIGISILGLVTWSLAPMVQKEGDSVQNQTSGVSRPGAPPPNPPDASLKDFVSSILGDTEDVWREQFQKMNQAYKEPHLVLFTRRVQSKCGMASSAIGPSYCPLDEIIYVDLGFFQEMKDRYGASGDFARAYVIAHEVGHHVQKLLGIHEKALAAPAGVKQGRE